MVVLNSSTNNKINIITHINSSKVTNRSEVLTTTASNSNSNSNKT